MQMIKDTCYMLLTYFLSPTVFALSCCRLTVLLWLFYKRSFQSNKRTTKIILSILRVQLFVCYTNSRHLSKKLSLSLSLCSLYSLSLFLYTNLDFKLKLLFSLTKHKNFNSFCLYLKLNSQPREINFNEQNLAQKRESNHYDFYVYLNCSIETKNQTTNYCCSIKQALFLCQGLLQIVGGEARKIKISQKSQIEREISEWKYQIELGHCCYFMGSHFCLYKQTLTQKKG